MQTAATLCLVTVSYCYLARRQKVSQQQVFGVRMHQTISSLRAPAVEFSQKAEPQEGGVAICL